MGDIEKSIKMETEIQEVYYKVRKLRDEILAIRDKSDKTIAELDEISKNLDDFKTKHFDAYSTIGKQNGKNNK